MRALRLVRAALHPSARLWRPVVAAVAAVAVTAGVGMAPGYAQSGDEPGLVVLGDLEDPEKFDPDDPLEIVDGRAVVAVTEDPPRLLYSYARSTADTDFTRYLREYDASPTVPEFTGREVALGTTSDLGVESSPFITAIDTTRNRLLVMSLSREISNVVVVDLDDFSVVDQWNLTESVPGFLGKGITYDPDHDRVYAVGSLLGVEINAGYPDRAVVAAFDPRDGGAIWSRPVPECQKLANVHKTGTLIASSAHRPELSFFCRHQDAIGIGEDVQSRSSPSGLVQLNIEPDAGALDAARFPVEFHRVGGIYTSGKGGAGIAAFDRESDRFFVQSLSPKAPGTWVFDGDEDTWMGFISARPPDFGVVERNGFSPVTGHYYMIAVPGNCGDPPTGECGYVQVTDGRTTPIPQGVRVENDINRDIVADPASSRIFARTPDRSWIVLRDDIPPLDVLDPVEYDNDTDDVPESEDTFTFFSGTARGFGARARLVGGVESSGSAARVESAKGVLSLLLGLDRLQPVVQPLAEAGIDEDAFNTSTGTRSVTTAEVTSAALGVAGSTATAQTAALDDGTAGDLDALQRRLGAEDVALWPYTPVNCSDGRSEPEEAADEDPVSAGASRASCDREAEETTASTSFGRFGPGDVVSVASSGVDTRLVRVGVDEPADAKVVAVETVATAEGVEVGTPDDEESPGGSVSIGEVRSVARIAAGGRTGTATARWVRTLQDVVVRDAAGEVVAGPGSCVTVVDAEGGEEVDSCASIVDAANQVLHTTMQLQLPMAAVTATLRGAFAEVRQQDADHLRDSSVRDEADLHVPGLDLVLFNDGAEKSRMVVELAALQADAIYQITDFGFGTLPDPGPTDQPTGDESTEMAIDDDLLEDTTSGSTSTTGTTSASSGSDSQGAAVESTVPQGEAFDFASAPQAEQPEIAPRQSGVPSVGQMGSGLQLLARDPAQAALVGGVWLLFAGALTTLLRRIQLRQLATT